MSGFAAASVLRLLGVAVALALVLAACDMPDLTTPVAGEADVAAEAETDATPETTTDAIVDEAPLDPSSSNTAASSELTLPARAAFLYPWFPNAWSQRGVEPATHYGPTLGRYDSSAADVTATQLEWARRAKLDAFISSWWGPGRNTDRALDAKMTAAEGDALKWAVYHEGEGQGDPTVSELVADLEYLDANYFHRPNYAHVDGAPVVFVYNAEADGGDVDVLERWARAEAEFGKPVYVNLKVFRGYTDAAPQPDSWHQYGAANRFGVHEPHAAYVSPGFHHYASSTPRLTRDEQAFADAVRRMDAAEVDWKLIQTWNEWGEGTAVEPAQEWGSTYIDIIGESAGDHAPAPTPPTPPGPSQRGDVTFAFAGDIGGDPDRAGVVLPAAEDAGATWMAALGDLSYSEITPESAWCDWAASMFAGPIQIVAGNHEADGGPDGDIRAFAACMPDRMGSTLGPGGYAANYYFDDGPVRTILISADLSVGGTDHSFRAGTAERQWLIEAIRTAPHWVVVGTHKVCLTMGNKSCEIGDDLVDLLHAEGVDLVAHGHDHDYQRTHALSCSDPQSFRADCIGDDGADGRYRRDAGTVHVIVGTVGRSLTTCDHDDPEAGYFAAHFCGEEDKSAKGYVLVNASKDRLDVTYRNVRGTSFVDTFVIE